jgi:hypothetical protein
MAEIPRQSRRIVGLALFAGAGILTGMALAINAGLAPVEGNVRSTVAGVLGLAAALDLLIGFWFFRSSLSA